MHIKKFSVLIVNEMLGTCRKVIIEAVSRCEVWSKLRHSTSMYERIGEVDMVQEDGTIYSVNQIKTK